MKLLNRLQTTADNIELKTVHDCDDDTIEALRKLRNLPSIRDNMYTNHEISPDEHFNWASRQKDNQHEIFFFVFYEAKLIGGASLNKVDKLNKRAEWAFYLSPDRQGKGLGAALEYKMLEFSFTEIKLNKLDCEVLEFNTSVISMHKRFGFKEEGCRRARIIRDGKPIDAVLLGITAKEWEAIKTG